MLLKQFEKRMFIYFSNAVPFDETTFVDLNQRH